MLLNLQVNITADKNATSGLLRVVSLTHVNSRYGGTDYEVKTAIRTRFVKINWPTKPISAASIGFRRLSPQ